LFGSSASLVEPSSARITQSALTQSAN
jgi:hypothetical protein